MSNPESPVDHRATSVPLATLRAALAALPLGDDLPDPERLDATLQVLDPVLSGDAFGLAAWVFHTGMPGLAWLTAPSATRDALLAAGGDELPDEGLVQATSLDPELGRRLMETRRFERFLRRHPVTRPVRSGVLEGEEGAFAFMDVVLPDGRWMRLRRPPLDVAPLAPPSGTDGERWADVPFDELSDHWSLDVRRTLIGPVWRPSGAGTSDDFGLLATVEDIDGARRHLAVPRHLLVEARSAGVGTVHAFELPAAR